MVQLQHGTVVGASILLLWLDLRDCRQVIALSLNKKKFKKEEKKDKSREKCQMLNAMTLSNTKELSNQINDLELLDFMSSDMLKC